MQYCFNSKINLKKMFFLRLLGNIAFLVGLDLYGSSQKRVHSHCAFAYFFQNHVVKSEPNGDEVQKVENKAEKNEKVERRRSHIW